MMHRSGRARVAAMLLAAAVAGCPQTTTSAPDAAVDPMACLRMTPLRFWSSTPSVVALLYRIEQCVDGKNIILEPDGVGTRFQDLYDLSENGQPLSAESVPRITRSLGQRAYVSLLLDFSASVGAAGSPARQSLIASATKFAQSLLDASMAQQNIYVEVRIFDGRPLPYTIVQPTRDAARITAALMPLVDAPSNSPLLGTGADNGSTNLYGAFTEGVKHLQETQVAVIEAHRAGVATTGYLVVFTDGRDTSTLVSQATAVMTVGNATKVLTSGQPVTTTYAVAQADGQDYTPAAREALVKVVGEKNLLEGTTDELDARFQSLATKIADQAAATHLLVYCSPARTGTRTVKLGVSPRVGGTAAGSNSLTFVFSAGGFSAGCIDFLETVCLDRVCGGFNCGGCDDETSACNDAGVCQSACVTQDKCAGEMIVNTLGYAQECAAASPGLGTCGTACADTLNDPNNCGSCGNACGTVMGTAIPQRCVMGGCVAPAGG